jgi:hypothetical protein
MEVIVGVMEVIVEIVHVGLRYILRYNGDTTASLPDQDRTKDISYGISCQTLA